MPRLPSIKRDFLLIISYFIINPTLCLDFVSLLKGQIVGEFQNMKKNCNSLKKYGFTKGMHSYVSNVGLNRKDWFSPATEL